MDTPWVAKEYPADDAWHIHTPDGGWLASVHIDGEPELARKQARLIAAAPELLEALKVFGDLVDTVEKTFPNDPVSAGQVCRGSVSFRDFQNARDAVKKATQP